jgi:hypothetical protein
MRQQRIAVRSAEQLERTARIVPARVIRLRAGSLELPGRYILAKNLRLFILARCGQSARVRSTLKGQSYDKLRVHVE